MRAAKSLREADGEIVIARRRRGGGYVTANRERREQSYRGLRFSAAVAHYRTGDIRPAAQGRAGRTSSGPTIQQVTP